LPLLHKDALQQRQARMQGAVQKLRSTDELLQASLVEHDRERFAFVLDSQDAAWYRTQLSLFEAGQLLDRSAFGLRLNSTERTHIPEMHWIDARQSVYSYTAELLPDAPSVELKQTAFYRFDGIRWWLSAAPAEYWGPRVTLRTGSFLQVSVPRRDETYAKQLADVLDARIEQLCETLDCPANYRVLIQLEVDPRLLLPSGPEQSVISFGLNTLLISLPTPALVGLPVSNGSAQAFLEGHAQIIEKHIRQHLSTK